MGRKTRKMKLFKDMQVNARLVVKAKKRKTREGYRSLAEYYNKTYGKDGNRYISVSLDIGPDVVVLHCLTYDKYLEWKAGNIKHSALIGEIKKKPVYRAERQNKEIGAMQKRYCNHQGTIGYYMPERIYYTHLSQKRCHPLCA